MITAEEIIKLLNLKPHPREGGFYSEIYRSAEKIPMPALSNRYNSSRSFSTSIYYLLTPDTFSRMHRLVSDEIFHFYLGDPVEMLQLRSDGSGGIVIIGTDLEKGMRPQVVVPRGVWQGCRLVKGGRFALLGTTVAPSFDFADYEEGDHDFLASAYPKFKKMINALIPE